MQTLDVISVNLWQILISFANLLILFFLLKKFLFAPVKRTLDARRAEIDEQYESARVAEQQAKEHEQAWQEKLSAASGEAEEIIRLANQTARMHADEVEEAAHKKAEGMIRVAQGEIELSRVRAAEEIKQEIVEVSGTLAEKLLEREINRADHDRLIESALGELEHSND